MGNRGVIINYVEGETTKQFEEFLKTGEGIRRGEDAIGVYLHWNGGYDSVNAFLTYCKMRGFRSTNTDNYGWARLIQVIGNFFGGDLSIGVGPIKTLDCDNWDNGVYLIKDWEIKGRYFFEGEEQTEHKLGEMLKKIDKEQPEGDRLGEKEIEEKLKEMED